MSAMKLKTPSFWYRPKTTEASLLEHACTPFSCLYKLGYKIHQGARAPEKVNAPVICIGNINAGGTGKTPTALAIMDVIRRFKLAKTPHFLIRGYGGGDIGPFLVDTGQHNAWNTGDEALILAKHAATIVSIDRALGANLAINKGADMVVMDDGLQNPGIHKDIKIVVINGEMGFGNGKMMPAGPLRQPLKEGLAHADGFIVIGDDKRGTINLLPKEKPIFHAELKADEKALPSKDKSYLAFAGLGYPEKFFTFIKDTLGMNIVETVSFSDHYPYQKEDLLDLHAQAEKQNATLLTTEKDFLRLPEIKNIDVQTVPVKLSFQDEDALVDFLKSRLS